VAVTSDGALQTEAAGGHPLLAAAVEEALRASVFLSNCSGKTVRLIFNFGFDSDPGKRVSFGNPNQFWISVTPKHFQP
jgi:hypothetical protein